LLRISRSDTGRRTLGILEYDHGVLTMPLGDEETAVGSGAVELGVYADETRIQFRWRDAHPTGDWQEIGPSFDPTKLSDDYAIPLGFTGTFVGVGCFDTSGRRMPADFGYLSYREW
ncbi:MAG: glycoside hydrolase 43 family protein, partial [Alkalispirochaeta sp.]